MIQRSKLDIKALLAKAKSLKYTTDDTGVLMACSQGKKLPGFEEVETEIGPVKYLMINILPPGVSIPKHKDHVYGEKNQRWHLALATNSKCYLNGKNVPAGYWSGPIPYWEEHDAKNLGSTERVHLIVDLLLSAPKFDKRSTETQGTVADDKS